MLKTILMCIMLIMATAMLFMSTQAMASDFTSMPLSNTELSTYSAKTGCASHECKTASFIQHFHNFAFPDAHYPDFMIAQHYTIIEQLPIIHNCHRDLR